MLNPESLQTLLDRNSILDIPKIDINDALKQKVSFQIIDVNEALIIRKNNGLYFMQNQDILDENAIHIAIKYNGEFLAYLRIIEKNNEGMLLPFQKDNQDEISTFNGNIITNIGDVEIGRLIINKELVIKNRINNINSYIMYVIQYIKELTPKGKIYIAVVENNIRLKRYLDIGFKEICDLSSDARYGGLNGKLLVF